MSADNRTVATDALATLGTILTEPQGRDAIHLAVISVVASHFLDPGDHVGLFADGTAGDPARTDLREAIGIVDPFLSTGVRKGQRFWLVIYPRKITSLRHVWSHPAFKDEDQAATPAVTPDENDPVERSKRWIREFASKIEVNYNDDKMTYDFLMESARKYVENGETTCLNSEDYQDYWHEFREFWRNYAIVTGKKVDEEEGGSFFHCAC